MTRRLFIMIFILAFSLATMASAQLCTVSEIEPWSGGSIPENWLPADGRTLPSSGSAEFLYATGGEYGGDGHRIVSLPDTTSNVQSQATHIICVKGRLPDPNEKAALREAIYEAMAQEDCEIGASIEYPNDLDVPESWLRQEGQTITEQDYSDLHEYLASEGQSQLDDDGSIICAIGDLNID